MFTFALTFWIFLKYLDKKAKRLLKKLNIAYKEISVDFNPKLRAEMAEKAGKTSVPQIWFDDNHIGGCDDLHDLHETDDLVEFLH